MLGRVIAPFIRDVKCKRRESLECTLRGLSLVIAGIEARPIRTFTKFMEETISVTLNDLMDE